jgi:thiol-disulfide isomerase/thioredoxin
MKIIGLFIGVVLLSVLSNAQTIPRWKITDVIDYYSKQNDSVYVINFWATFCKPCVAEIPHLQAITKKYKAQKVKLVLVSLDLPAYYPGRIGKFARANKFTADIAWLNETDADYFCTMIDKKWSGSIPATLFVNSKKGYKKFFEAELNKAEFEKELQMAIGD